MHQSFLVGNKIENRSEIHVNMMVLNLYKYINMSVWHLIIKQNCIAVNLRFQSTWRYILEEIKSISTNKICIGFVVLCFKIATLGFTPSIKVLHLLRLLQGWMIIIDNGRKRMNWTLREAIEKYSAYLSRVLSKSKLMEWFLICILNKQTHLG